MPLGLLRMTLISSLLQTLNNITGGGRAPKKNYKGRSRHFTDEESLREQLEKERREKQWRVGRIFFYITLNIHDLSTQ